MAIATLSSSSGVAQNYRDGAIELSDTRTRIRTGQRILRIGDDASSISIATPLQSQSRIDRTARNNSAAGVSLLAVAQEGLQQIQLLLDTLAGLATQGTDAGLSSQNRALLNAQFQGGRNQIDNVASATKFNGIALLDGSIATPGGLDYRLSNTMNVLRVSIPSVTSASLFSGATPEVNSVAQATSAVTQVADAQNALLAASTAVNAYSERFAQSDGNLQTTLGGLTNAVGQLLNADQAGESLSFTQQFLRQNTSAVVLAQSLRINANVLQLLA